MRKHEKDMLNSELEEEGITQSDGEQSPVMRQRWSQAHQQEMIYFNTLKEISSQEAAGVV